MKERVTSKNSKSDALCRGKVQARPSAAKLRPEDDPLDEHLRFERMISEFAARFVNIASDHVDGEIEHALKQILDFFQVDRCGLLRISPDRKGVHVTHAAYAEGIEQVSGDINFVELFPWCHEKLVIQGQPVCFARIEELPEKAEQDRANHLAMGVRSLLDIPLFFEGSVSSIIVITTLRRHCSWPEEYIPQLRLLGEIFINALERRNADRVLRESKARLSLATDAAGVMPWHLDMGSGQIWTTGMTKEFFGFAPDSEMDIESFLNVVHSEDRERLRQSLEETLQSGKDSSTEYRIRLQFSRPDALFHRWHQAIGAG